MTAPFHAPQKIFIKFCIYFWKYYIANFIPKISLKCKLVSKNISSPEYQISGEGISPDERRTNKIAKMEKPSKKELESFLELINFYNRYLPRCSELTEPFVEIRKKKK